MTLPFEAFLLVQGTVPAGRSEWARMLKGKMVGCVDSRVQRGARGHSGKLGLRPIEPPAPHALTAATRAEHILPEALYSTFSRTFASMQSL